GVIAGMEKLRKGKYPKKAILLISDGVDTTSNSDYTRARIAVRESEALLYALGIAPDAAERGPMTERTPPATTRRRGNTPSIQLPGGIQIPLPGRGQRQFPGGGGGGGNTRGV